MTDSSVPRLLGQQTDGSVELVDLQTVRLGYDALRQRLRASAEGGARFTVVDALDDDDLATIGAAVALDPLVTGAAGLAGGLAGARAALRGAPSAPPAPGVAAGARAGEARPAGPAAVLAGSCSARTLEQVADMRAGYPSHRLDAVRTPEAGRLAAEALAWYDSQHLDGPVLIYSSLPPAELAEVQGLLGVEAASELLETAMGLVARGLVDRGIGRIVVAGGETSGAVVTALAVRGGVVGDEAAPGVPWIRTAGDHPLDLLLKSGNFGDATFLRRAATSILSHEEAA